MFNVFDRLVSQSFGAQPGMAAASASNPGQPQYSDMITQAINKVRQKPQEQQLKSDQKNVSDIYKQHNLALAARGEGPWAQQMSAGQVPEGAKLDQNDAMNYHIMRRTYLDAKQETDRLDSQEAEKEWKAHMAQRGIQGSIPGEGN